MVQIHNLGPSRKSLLRESMGQSLGQGLSSFVNNYFAGKALDEVTKDSSFQNGSMGERASKLEQAMRPYGEYGANVLKNRMGIEQQLAQEAQQKQMQALQKKKAPLIARALKGEDLSDEEMGMFTPEEQLAIAKHNQVREQQERKLNTDREGKIAPLETALETVDEMRKLRKKGNLGRGSGIIGLAGGETARDRGKYEQLGKSLIQYATNIPIRNQLEFETLAERLYDASITDAEAEGVLDAMENIIKNSLRGVQGIENQTKQPSNSEKPGFVKMKDPQGITRWVPENIAKQMQGG